MFSDDDKPPEARQTSAPVRLRSHPPRGPFGTARAILTQLGYRVVRRLTEGSAPNPPHPGFEMRRTWADQEPWSEEESDEALHAAGLSELADNEDDLSALPGWPALQAKLHDQFTKTGAFAEPKLKAPSPPHPPTLLAGGLITGESYFVEEDGSLARIPKNHDDVRDKDHVPEKWEVVVPRRAKKSAKADSVSSGEAAPEERHTRAVLALVSAEPRGAAKKAPIDPIDAADLETCRAALKAVRDAVYGVSPDDMNAWEPDVSSWTTVWLPAAPMALNRTAEVHGALAEYGLDVHAENEPLVAFAQASGILLVGLDDLDLPDDGGGEE